MIERANVLAKQALAGREKLEAFASYCTLGAHPSWTFMCA
jgi:hypothetical protein